MVLLVRENRIVIDDVALMPCHNLESYSGGNGTKDSWDSLSQGIAYASAKAKIVSFLLW